MLSLQLVPEVCKSYVCNIQVEGGSHHQWSDSSTSLNQNQAVSYRSSLKNTSRFEPEPMPCLNVMTTASSKIIVWTSPLTFILCFWYNEAINAILDAARNDGSMKWRMHERTDAWNDGRMRWWMHEMIYARNDGCTAHDYTQPRHDASQYESNWSNHSSRGGDNRRRYTYDTFNKHTEHSSPVATLELPACV